MADLIYWLIIVLVHMAARRAGLICPRCAELTATFQQRRVTGWERWPLGCAATIYQDRYHCTACTYAWDIRRRTLHAPGWFPRRRQ
jgi:hypothetical protein